MSYLISQNPIIDSSLLLYYDVKNQKSWLPNNILRNSTDFSSWNKSLAPVNTTSTSNANAFGTIGSYLISDTTNNSQHYIYTTTNITVTAGLIYTATFYLKKASHSWITFGFTSQIDGTGTGTAFNFDTGSFGASNGAILSSNINKTINDYWKISITIKATTTAAGNPLVYISSTNNTNSAIPIQYTGVNTNFVESCGVQVVQSNVDKPFEITGGTITNPTMVVDLMNSNNGVLTNGTVADGCDGIFRYDGVNDSVYRSVFNNVPSSTMTVSAWINTTINSGTIMTQNRTPSSFTNTYMFYINGGKLTFWDFDSVGFGYNQTGNTNNTTLPLGTWCHVTFVKNGLNGTYYLNGNNDGSVVAARNITYGANDFYLGANVRDGNYLNGKIALPMIYNRALSQAEILQNYNSQKNRFTP